MNRTAQLFCAWSGPLLAALFIPAFVLLAQFIPPPHPTDSGEEIAAMYQGNLTEIRVGMFVGVFAATLLGPWGAAIASQTRRTESGFPALTYTQLICAAVGVVTFLLPLLVWAVASFRPDDVLPETTRTMNDFGWFLLLFTVPPFSVWMVAIALSILLESDRSPYPRWAAYLNLWAALLLAPGALLVFFKTGAFAFNGLITLYVPFVAFFIWLITMTVLTIQAINREGKPAATDQAPGQSRLADAVGSGPDPAGEPG